MLDLELLVNLSEPNKINKRLNAGPVLSGLMRDGSSILDPVIRVEAEYMTGYNYCHIPLFDRYYHIIDITAVRTGLWQLTLHTDTLMTYRTQLMSVPVILAASTERGADDYLSGPQWAARQKELTDIVTFPSGLSQEGEFILITAGG